MGMVCLDPSCKQQQPDKSKPLPRRMLRPSIDKQREIEALERGKHCFVFLSTCKEAGLLPRLTVRFAGMSLVDIADIDQSDD